MKKIAALMLTGLLFGLLLHAQTIGGDTSLSSKTWTWTNQSADLSAFTLVTPTQDSDFLITIYVGDNLNNDAGGSICPTLLWTDNIGSQSTTMCSSVNGPANSSFPVNASLPIHVAANTSVSISVAYEVPTETPQPIYELVVGKIKINP